MYTWVQSSEKKWAELQNIIAEIYEGRVFVC
jgi:hypothetical protein